MDRTILVNIVKTVLSTIGSLLKKSSTVKVIFEKTVPMLCISFEKMLAKKKKTVIEIRKGFLSSGSI